MGKAATMVVWIWVGLLLILPGCGGEKTRPPLPWDVHGPVDAAETEQPPLDAPVCTIQKPMANRILTGTVEVRVVVGDPMKEKISRVVFAFLASGKPPVKVGEVTAVSEDGSVTSVVDSAKVADGSYTFFCQVETADGRKGSSGVSVKVDNTPPKIELYPPSTPPFSNFLSDLVIRVSVSDGNGVGTDRVVIRVNGDAVANLVKPPSGLQNPLTVRTYELLKGRNTVEISASDTAGNVTPSPLSYWVNFIPPPWFLSSDEWTLPKDSAIERVVGIQTLQGSGIVGWGSKGAHVLMPGTSGTLGLTASLVTTSVILAKVADLDQDDLEDVVLVTSEPGERSTVQFFAQEASGAFSSTASWRLTIDGRVNDLAFGDLNRDGRPDLAVTLQKASASVGVALSKSGLEKGWSGFTIFGGVEDPNLVAVGDFTADGDNDVMVTRKGSGIVTVYPVNGATGTLLVGVNTELKISGGGGTSTPVTGLKSLVLGPRVRTGKGDTVLLASETLNTLFHLVPDPGMGLGRVAIHATYPSCQAPNRLVRADADMDGWSDVLVWCTASAMVQVEWGRDDGGFFEGSAFLVGQESADVTFAALSGGSRPDIVALDRTNQKVRVLTAVQGSARHFKGAPMARLDFRPMAIAAGRYTKPLSTLPRHRDLALLGVDAKGQSIVQVVVASEDTGLPTQRAGVVDGRVRNPTGLVSADLDKNNYDDLLIPSQSTSASDKREPTMGRLLFREGASHVLPSVIGEATDPVTGQSVWNGMWAGDAPTIAVVADLKREAAKPGVLDLAVVAKFRTGPVGNPLTLFQPFVGHGDGTFRIQEGVLYPVNEAQGPSSLAAGRLTGGSNYDVVMTNAKSGEFMVFFQKGLGLFLASEGEAAEFAVGPNPKRVVIETLDAEIGSTKDPYPELVFLLENDVAIVKAAAKVGDIVQYAPPVFLGHTGRSPVDIAVRDVNGDGYADISVLDQQDSMVTIYLNLAQDRFSDPFRYRVGVSPVGMVVADLDADNCLDIATADQSGQSVTLLRNLSCSGP